MNARYQPLLGNQEGACRLHIHRTELSSAGLEDHYTHSHQAEEAMFILEGRGEFVIDGRGLVAGPGEVVFFPSGSVHGITRVLEGTMHYVTIRTVEEGNRLAAVKGVTRAIDYRSITADQGSIISGGLLEPGTLRSSLLKQPFKVFLDATWPRWLGVEIDL